MVAGRCLPTSRRGYDLTVAELGAAYWNWATGYYRKDGQPTRSLDRVRLRGSFPVVPRHPVLRLRGQFARVAFKLREIIERIGSAQLAGVDQAHEGLDPPCNADLPRLPRSLRLFRSGCGVKNALALRHSATGSAWEAAG